MKLRGMILLFYLSLEVSSSTRRKRVLNGDIVKGRKNGYTAVNYFAAIGTAHGKPWWSIGFWNFLKNHGVYGEISCGGAILTPSIIQTACHCIATFPFSVKGQYVDQAVVNHHWEGTLAVYAGVNNRFPTYGHEDEPAMSTIPKIESEKFFVHPKCGKLPDTSNVYVSFDVGIIRVGGNWFSGNYGVPTDTVTIAPLYSTKQLDKMFQRLTEIQAVCLVLGFGFYGINYMYPSDVMRQGWQVLMSRKPCIESTTNDLPDEKNYTQYLSWACAQRMVKYDQSPEHGDSGGPVSCNNYFFGLVSSEFYEGSEPINVYTANKYIPFITSYESREALQKFVDSVHAYSFPDQVKYFYHFKTPNPDLRRWKPKRDDTRKN